MNRKTIFLTYTLVLIGVFASAQVATPFKERFSRSIEGGITIIANNMVSRTATGNYNGPDDNTTQPSVYVDIDNDPTTFNSSSAEFINPEVTEPCIDILRAFLYWAAADAPSGIFGDEDNQPDWDFNEVKLMLPGENEYTTVTADEVIYRDRDDPRYTFNNQPYICVKDLTDDVTILGEDIYGDYQVANVEAKIGRLGSVGTAAGWQIVFIYESPELPAKNITLFDGYSHIESPNGANTNVVVDFDGFITVPNGPVRGDIVMGGLEGDRRLRGDQLQIRNVAGAFENLVAPQRDPNNFFNSRITVNDGDFIDRNPASTNTLGFDAAVFELNNPNNTILNNQSTATTIRITSNQETYGLYLLGLAVEVYKPNLDPMLITQTQGSPTPNPGDIIGFNFNLENRGNDDTLNLSLSSNLPNQLVFVPPANLPPGVTFTYNQLPDNLLVFEVADGILDVGSPPLGIDMQFMIKDDCFFLEENCDLDFEIMFEASFNGATNPDDPLISISTVDPSTCLDTPVIINVVQPPINWATAPQDLDRTLSCEDVAGLEAAQLLAPITDKCNPFQFITLNRIAGEFVPEPDCPNAGTYTNRWNFTDQCGVTIADYVQTIRIEDVVPPTATNPELVSVQCLGDVPAEDPSVVIDEADNCSEPTVAFVSQVSDGQTCPETITRIYRVTDACGNSTEVTHVVEINDTIAPTASNPASINVVCIEDVPLQDPNVVIDEADNCSQPTVAFVSEVSDGATCPETITRTYSVTDACGNITNVTQAIIINDDIAPELVSTLEPSITISCDDVPEPPLLEFTDNCGSDVTVDFEETTETVDPINYTVIRTWTASDACGNQNVYEQRILVEPSSVSDTGSTNICIDEPSIDLNNFVTNTDDLSGEWTASDPVLIDGSIFDPSNKPAGDYVLTYTYTNALNCSFITEVTVSVNEDCVKCVKTLADDVSVSKLVTPNNDGVNDFLEVAYEIKNTNARLCAFSISLDIYNRWGVRVYSDSNYNNTWKGESPNSSVGASGNLPTGTYYYIVKFNDTAEEIDPIQGFILLGSS